MENRPFVATVGHTDYLFKIARLNGGESTQKFRIHLLTAVDKLSRSGPRDQYAN